MNLVRQTEPLFKVPEYARIKECLIGVHALNAFAHHDSSPRLAMLISHVSQCVVLNHPDEKIIQTGIDHQLGQNTFSVKVEEDCIVVGVVERYRTIHSDQDPVEYIIFVRNVDTGEFDHYTIPYYFSLHQYFGFQYKYDKHEIRNVLRPGTFLQKGTTLADSPAVHENDGYAFGKTTNFALLTDVATSEDGIVISESYAKRLQYSTFETRTISFGSDKLPLNLYGDDTNYKGFPDLGEFVGEDSILTVLRESKDTVGFSLTSKEDLKRFNHVCDHPVYLPGPGKWIVNADGEKVKSGYVVDIKAYENPKAKTKHNFYPETTGDIKKHVEALKFFYREIVNIYEQSIEPEINKKSNKKKVVGHEVSPRLHKLIMEAYAISDQKLKQMTLVHRYTPLDRYMVTFTVKYVNDLKIGSKQSDLDGAKGVVVVIRPDHLMPRDKNGVVYDVIMDPTSVISRLNLGRLYQQYFNAASRVARNKVRDILTKNPNAKKEAWDLVLKFVNIMGTPQYDTYLKATPDQVDIVLKEVMEKELFIFYNVACTKPAYIIVREIEESEFKPLKDKMYIPQEDGTLKETVSNVLGGPIYAILLSKTPDEFLSAVASATTNHFGFAIAPSSTKKYAYPVKENPTRFISETEFRSYLAYGGPELIAELKARGNSLRDHKVLYENILKSGKGFNKDLVPREIFPYNDDSTLKIMNSVFSAMGIELQYHRDPESDFIPGISDPKIGFKKVGKQAKGRGK